MSNEKNRIWNYTKNDTERYQASVMGHTITLILDIAEEHRNQYPKEFEHFIEELEKLKDDLLYDAR